MLGWRNPETDDPHPTFLFFMKKEVEHKGNSVYNEVPTQHRKGIVMLYG
jgi:hypothetical protein